MLCCLSCHQPLVLPPVSLEAVAVVTEAVFLFWPCRTACGVLVPRPGIEPVPPALEVCGLNRWTTSEVPTMAVF